MQVCRILPDPPGEEWNAKLSHGNEWRGGRGEQRSDLKEQQVEPHKEGGKRCLGASGTKNHGGVVWCYMMESVQ